MSWAHVRALLRLRFTVLMRTQTRSSWLGLGLLTLMLLAMSAGLFFGVRQQLAAAADTRTALRLLLAAIGLLGVLLPLMSFHRGSSADPAALFTLPIAPFTVFAGSVLARLFSLTSLLPAAIAVALATSFEFLSVSAAGRLLIYLTFHVLILALSQTLLLAYHTVLARQRVRDAMTVFGAVLGVGLYLGTRIAIEHGLTSSVIQRASQLPEWIWQLSPTTWTADLVLDPTSVSAGGGALAASGLLIALVGCCLAGGRASSRAFFAEVETGTPARRRIRKNRSGFGFLAHLPLPVAARAIAQRELLLFWRDPHLKGLLIRQIGFFVIPVLLPFFSGSHPRDLSFVVHLMTLCLLLGECELLLNVLGHEGYALQQTLTLPIRGRDLFLGKNLACAVWLLPFNLGVLFGVDALTRAGTPAIAIAVQGTATLAVALGLGNVASLLFPSARKTRARRAISTQAQEAQRGRFFARTLLILTVALVSAPVVGACAWGATRGATAPVFYALAALYAMGVWTSAIVVVDRLLDSRVERLLRL